MRVHTYFVSVFNMHFFFYSRSFRDVFRDETVRALIDNSFLLWQRAHDSPHGEEYTRDYGVDGYPHLAVLDPRTLKRVCGARALVSN